MKRIYINNKLQKNLIYKLDQSQFIHLSKSIRLKLSDNLIIFNNEDGEWLSEVSEINKKIISIKCLNKSSAPKKIPNIDLFFSPIKYQSSESIIRQSTEIGIRNIYPTLFQRSVVRKINIKKFKTYAISASQQSGRTYVPKIHELISLKNQKLNLSNKNILMFDENLMGKKLSNLNLNLKKDICIIIGPEGGFEDTERNFIAKKETYFHNVKLGPRILKSDTALVSAISLVFHYFDND